MWKNSTRQDFVGETALIYILENFDKLVSKNMQFDRCVIACSTAEASSHQSTSSITGARSLRSSVSPLGPIGGARKAVIGSSDSSGQKVYLNN